MSDSGDDYYDYDDDNDDSDDDVDDNNDVDIDAMNVYHYVVSDYVYCIHVN